jgi:anti-sigma factor RsiW
MTSADELTCQELVELVTEYLDDALPPAERARFEAHLRECDPCIAYIDQVRTTVALLGRVRPGALEARSRDRMLERFRSWKRATGTEPERE